MQALQRVGRTAGSGGTSACWLVHRGLDPQARSALMRDGGRGCRSARGRADARLADTVCLVKEMLLVKRLYNREG